MGGFKCIVALVGIASAFSTLMSWSALVFAKSQNRFQNQIDILYQYLSRAKGDRIDGKAEGKSELQGDR
jgi:hypothetical protein